MRRRPKSTKSKVEAKPPVAHESLENADSGVRDLEKRLAESLERETATSEILRVISQSPTDAQPVFEGIAESARRLCQGTTSAVFTYDGQLIHLVALSGVDARGRDAWRQAFPRPPGRASGTTRAVLTGEIVMSPDVLEDPEYELTGAARAAGFRSGVSVPMVREGRTIGVISVTRAEPGPFPNTEMNLLKTFADQAVIAIENVRLFNETREALEQQTATGEILRVISSSPTDIQPVLDVIARNAVGLCDGYFSLVCVSDGERVHLRAVHNLPEEWTKVARTVYPLPLSSDIGTAQAIREQRVVHILDVQEDLAVSALGRERARLAGYHTWLGVPMLGPSGGLGVIAVARREKAAFTNEEIALLKTFADQAVIAIENVRLFNELEGRNRDLTATSDILQVISRSPTDAQPVFDTIAERAMRLCDAAFGFVGMFDGALIHVRALANMSPEGLDAIHQAFPAPPSRGSAGGRVILTGDVVQIPDALEDPEYQLTGAARAVGFRGILGVPMLHQGRAIGAISVGRPQPGMFSEEQVQVLKTFADQAVIAVENVRLFTELQTSNRELTTALDTQTATSDILRVISRSQADVQPVFDAIVASAVRLLGAHSGALTRIAGEQIELAAITSTSDVADAGLRARFPQPLSSVGPVARTIRDRAPLNVADADTDPRLPETVRANARVRGYRSQVVVPLLRRGEAIGAIGVSRLEAGGFTDDEIALLQTFADQAVIAIENVRLFKDLQTSNHELTESLAQQTATAEILRVISRSPTDLQPVFDTVVRNAVKLCGAALGGLHRIKSGQITLDAQYGFRDEELATILERDVFPLAISRGSVTGRAILERAVVHIRDIREDLEYGTPLIQTMQSFRTILAVPMFREGVPIGALALWRSEVRPFSEAEIGLVQTFADQAVIAIENARLLSELQARTGELTRSVEELTALGDVSRALSSTLNLDAVLQTIVTRASQLAGTDACSVFEYDQATEAFYLRATNNLDDEVVTLARQTPTHKGEGVQGRMAVTRQPVQVPDIAAEDAYHGPLRDILLRTGTRAVLAIPMLREDELIGGLTVNKKTPGEFSPEVIELLTTFATQSALAIQNARLFHEIEDKSRQLEAASRHKSEFLANMSHELRTPLNAIIGFSEVLAERMFGEVNAKQAEYLQDILESGRHLLSLINDILDLSKIEAGRMELEAADFDLPSAIDNALILVRERATRRGITLGRHIDEGLGVIHGDERKVKQVLLNLLSNALKFTPEGGRVEVRAALREGRAEVSVADTGVGIAPEDQAAVFEEFRQVGTADKKVEGTGLGLALSQKFVQLHGGRLCVESELGRGSTFTFTLPGR